MKKAINTKKMLSMAGLAAMMVASLVLYSCKGNGLNPNDPTLELGANGDIPAANADPVVAVNQIIEKHRCLGCHSGATAQAGLDLRPDNILAATVNVKSSQSDYIRIVPGEPENSLLLNKVASDAPLVGGRMPADNQSVLSDAELATISNWIVALANVEIECDPTVYGSECYVCTAADSLDQTKPLCCDPTDYNAWCYECTAADSLDVTKPKCYQCTELDYQTPGHPLCGCTPEQKDDPNDANCYDEVSFADDIQLIFDLNQCAGCHAPPNGAGYTQTGFDEGGLDLTEGFSYDALVNVPTWEAPTVAPTMRVVPGDPNNSYLYLKVAKTTEELEAIGKPGLYGRMPQGTVDGIDPDDIELIRRWIKQGAQNN